jgi:spermidine synthase
VWWALAAPVLLVPARAGRPRRVLVLGLGAGSAVRALRALDERADIVGVDSDAEVVALARRHFGLDALRVELVVDDAARYLRRDRRLFDLVIEDVFVGPSRTVRKPDWMLEEGFALIRRRLSPDGVLVSNTIHEMPAVLRRVRRLFRGRKVSIDVAGHHNRIVVAGWTVPAPRELRRRLAADGRLCSMLARVTVRDREATQLAMPEEDRRAKPRHLLQ